MTTPLTVDYDIGHLWVKGATTLDTTRFRTIPGAKYMQRDQLWRMPATGSQVAAMSAEFGNRMMPSDDAKRLAQGYIQLADQKLLVLQGRDDDILYPYQAGAVDWMETVGSCLLADDMGLGKTLMAIDRLEPGSIVVCTASTLYNWEEEIHRWSDLSTIVVNGAATTRRKKLDEGADVLIMTYDVLKSHISYAYWAGKRATAKQREPKELDDYTFKVAVLDEAHKIKNPAAGRTQAAVRLGQISRQRIAMTGTPVMNTPDDLWCLMQFVHPALLGSRKTCRERYFDMEIRYDGSPPTAIGINSGRRAEWDQMFEPYMIRRTKEEVLEDLPEKLPIQYRRYSLSAEQRKQYDAMVDEMFLVEDGHLLAAPTVLNQLIRLRQIACAPVKIVSGEVVGMDVSNSAKTHAIEDIIEELDGAPLVVYVDSAVYARGLADHFPGSVLVSGEVGTKERQKRIEKFQRGGSNLFIGTIGAGAEGITLTRANTIVLAQQSWSHAQNAQAIDRVHRIGQDMPVTPIVLIGRDTVEVGVNRTDQAKEMVLQNLVQDDLRQLVRGG